MSNASISRDLRHGGRWIGIRFYFARARDYVAAGPFGAVKRLVRRLDEVSGVDFGAGERSHSRTDRDSLTDVGRVTNIET